MHLTQTAQESKDIHFENMMENYGDILLRMCFMQLQDGEMARDAVQETFLKAYKKWNSFKKQSSELTWLTSIAINTCRDIRRTAWFRNRGKTIKLEDAREPAYTQAFEDDTVLQAVAALPEKYRLAILLYYYQDMRQEDISATLKVPINTVKTWLRRRKELLRTQLEGWFEA
jgi:RNA polymerase sigma-70 factor (ECF subfamily)